VGAGALVDPAGNGSAPALSIPVLSDNPAAFAESAVLSGGAESAGWLTGVLRGIRMGRGYHNFGSVSQSCFSCWGACWFEAAARAFPHPRSANVRNATTVVERNMATGGRMRLMQPIGKKYADGGE
jgi:hypothetical protein